MGKFRDFRPSRKPENVFSRFLTFDVANRQQELPSYLLKIRFPNDDLTAPIVIFETCKHGYQILKVVVQTTHLSESRVSGLTKGRKNNNLDI